MFPGRPSPQFLLTRDVRDALRESLKIWDTIQILDMMTKQAFSFVLQAGWNSFDDVVRTQTHQVNRLCATLANQTQSTMFFLIFFSEASGNLEGS